MSTFPESTHPIHPGSQNQLFTVPHADAFHSSTELNPSLFTLDELPGRDSSTPLNINGRTTVVAVDTAGANNEWIGTLSILGPDALAQRRPTESIRQIMDVLAKGGEPGSQSHYYLLMSVWVHPEYRRCGVGRLLVGRALELVRTGGGSDRDDEFMSITRKTVLLRVRPNNEHGARDMYENLGFMGVSSESDGHEIYDLSPSPGFNNTEVDAEAIEGWMSVTLGSEYCVLKPLFDK